MDRLNDENGTTPPDSGTKLKGKTGEDLEKAVLEKQTEKADQTELKDEQKIKADTITVADNEVLDPDD